MQFPKIAAIFGVSVDYLMTGKRNGIAFAGNILTNIVKDVDCYPEIGMLAKIMFHVRLMGAFQIPE